MEQSWKELIEELKSRALSLEKNNGVKYYRDNAMANIWYVIARIEETLLSTNEEIERLRIELVTQLHTALFEQKCEHERYAKEIQRMEKEHCRVVDSYRGKVDKLEQENGALREQLAEFQAKLPQKD